MPRLASKNGWVHAYFERTCTWGAHVLECNPLSPPPPLRPSNSYPRFRTYGRSYGRGNQPVESHFRENGLQTLVNFHKQVTSRLIANFMFFQAGPFV